MSKVLTPEKAGRELARVLDTIRRLREELANHSKEARGRIAKMEDRASELCDVVAGRVGVQVELDTGPSEEEETAEALGKARKISARKSKHEADEARAHAHAYALQRGPAWLAELVAKPDAPLFVPGEWWPETGLDGKLMHHPVKGRCPSGKEDWRDCATCLAHASAGPEARR